MERLKRSSIYLFGYSEMGFAIMMALSVNYYAYFLTDVAKIAAATAGIILLMARIGDMLSVFIAGALIEKVTIQKFGKYRTWLLIAPPITAACFILMFTNFTVLSPGVKAVFLGTVYVLAHLSVNLAWTSQAALIPILGNHPEDRVKLSALRGQSSYAANIIFGLIAMPLILALGGGNEAQGFLLTVVFFTALQIIGYQIQARVIKPFKQHFNVEAQQNVSLKDMIAQIFVNKWLLLFFVIEVCIFCARFMLLGLAVYYFKYVAQNMLLVSAFFTTVSVVGLVGAYAGEWVAQKVSKKKVYMIGLTLEVVCFALMWLVAKSPYAFIALNGLVSLGTGVAHSVMYAVYADTADYGEWKTGKNAKGMIMAMSALPLKIGIALSGVVIGMSLSAVGYVADAAPTTALTTSIINIATLVPGGIAAIALFGMVFYKLDEKRVMEIKQDLESRNNKVTA